MVVQVTHTTCVVIPAFNESLRLPSVLRKLKRLPVDTIVVDDGSADGTSAVVRAESAILVRHDVNRGKGEAIRSGLRRALGGEWREIVTLDGDGQHDPDEMPVLIEALRSRGADVVIGNRMHSLKGMPYTRVYCNQRGSAIVSTVCGQHIPDALIGFRAMTRRAVERTLPHLKARRYEIDPEILIQAAFAGLKIESERVTCIYGSEVSRIRPLIDLYYFLKLVSRSKRMKR